MRRKNDMEVPYETQKIIRYDCHTRNDTTARVFACRLSQNIGRRQQQSGHAALSAYAACAD